MKILLILAAADNDPLRNNDPFMPLSLALLAASAPGHDYTFVDMLGGECVDFNSDAEVVGISARITGESAAFRIADAFRSSGKTVILGGPQVSAMYHRAIEHADAVVVGEGEKLWPVVLDDHKRSALKKFYVAYPGRFDSRGLPYHQLDAFTDLASDIPRRAYRAPFKKKYVFDTVFAARGCPVECEFCSVTGLFGANVRKRPVEHVVEEIASFRGFYYLLDDTVFGRPDDYDYYIGLYERIARETRRELWIGQANLEAAATEQGRLVISKAARAGLTYVAIGIESINPGVLGRNGVMGKTGVKDTDRITERFKERIRFIQEQGIFISGWFPIGFDDDNYETVRSNLEFCRQTGIAPVISALEALPGTRLYERLGKEKRLDFSKRINIIHPRMNDDGLIAAIDNAMNEAYTLNEITQRTLRFAKHANVHSSGIHEHIKDMIKKTSFVFILQRKMRKGLFGMTNDFQKSTRA